MPTPTPNHPWYYLTPARFFIGLLVVQVFLFLSERVQWFPFNEKKGWTVLIAVGVVGVAVLVMILWGIACLLLRRRFQFSFRSLLLFLVAVSVPLAWFAMEMRKARRQGEAVEGVRELGGQVFFDYQYDKNGKWLAKTEPAIPMWLAKCLGDDLFCEVDHMYCDRIRLSDNDARLFRKLTSVKQLWLTNTQVSDKGLVHLGGMAELEWLFLGGTNVTDSGLVHLKGMTKLTVLNLDHTRISDKGLKYLKDTTKLQSLSLDHTPITDNGLRHLQEMTSLEQLFLVRKFCMGGMCFGETQITEEGIERLQHALPNCRIEH